MNRKWDFGNGKTSADSLVQMQFNTPGKHPVTLEVVTNLGCMATTVDTIEVHDLPITSYSADTVCTGLSINFINTSKGYSSNIWYFGDGDSSVTSSPVHKYKSAGNYVVSLAVTSMYGCKAVLVDTIVVYDLPIASFTADTVCAGKATSFINTSTSLSSSTWYFGDGDSSNSVSPTHKYRSAGDYIVYLLATSSQGCTDTFTQSVRVLDLPAAAFSFTEGANGIVSFVPDSQYYASYRWDFGDGDISDSVKPIHTYSGNGTYRVSLVATNASGCIDSITKQVTIITAGIENTDKAASFVEVFPNPFHSSFTLKYSLANIKKCKHFIA